MADHDSEHPEPGHRDPLISSYLDESIIREEFSELKRQLKDHSGARNRYFEWVKNDVLLRGIVGDLKSVRGNQKKLSLLPMLIFSGIASLVVATFLLTNAQNLEVATIGKVSPNTRWLSSPMLKGAPLKEGSRIKLASVSVEVHYLSGAMTRLHGPVLLELILSNSGFLHYGEAFFPGRQ